MSERVFEITRFAAGAQPGDRIFTLTGGDTIRKRGVAVGTTTGGAYAVAASGNFLGMLARDVTTDGPTLAQLRMIHGPGGAGTDPNYEELPYKSGNVVALELADEFEAEGSDHLYTSGTGQVDADTAVGTLLEPIDGRWREDQSSGANACYRVTKVATTGLVVSTNAVRITAERIKN
jgi:hypothetical protein